jgi:ribonucleotide monophosphatase NagD (HAD superfamily)
MTEFLSKTAVVVTMWQVNVGKGGSWLFPFLLEHFHIEPSRTAVVGDRLDTDIALAKEGGLISILPLTGVQLDCSWGIAPWEGLSNGGRCHHVCNDRLYV